MTNHEPGGQAATEQDFVRPFLLEVPGFLGRLTRLGPTAEAILSRHDYPEAVARLLGEFLALTGTLGSLLKFDGIFTVQTKGDGPVHMMVADVTADGALRGYAEVDRERLGPDPRGGAGLLGAGYMAFTVDPGGDSERYQGIVEISGDSLADCVHHYFRQSEQLKSGIKLAAARHEGIWHAGALLVQQLPSEAPGDERDWMPGAPPEGWEDGDEGDGKDGAAAVLGSGEEDDWRRSQALMASCSERELLDPALSPDDLLYRLFHQERVRVYRTRPLGMGCRCSRPRIETILRSLPRGEVEDMKVDGQVVMTCQFCNVDFKFDDAGLEQVYSS